MSKPLALLADMVAFICCGVQSFWTKKTQSDREDKFRQHGAAIYTNMLTFISPTYVHSVSSFVLTLILGLGLFAGC